MAVPASESHSIRSRVYVSVESLSRFKSGSMSVIIASLPMMYAVWSDWSTPFRKSNVAESVTVF